MSSSIHEDQFEFEVNAITVHQPIGEFLIASIPSKLLCDIAYFDMRRMLKERDIETYLGIQRPLNPDRVAEIKSYVNTMDACFPTAVILSISSRCATFDPQKNKLTIRNVPNPEDGLEPVYLRNVAQILDGQHRIAGLVDYPNDNFEVNVSIFIDADIEDQAYIFSTVNLAQTKVNRSLAYDLTELANARSPQKTCHNIAVALDKLESSPFHKRIRRLGTSTPGRKDEKLNQATFVEALIDLISSSPMLDRDILKRGNKLGIPNQAELDKFPLRLFFVNGEDMKIADVIFRYFSAVKDRWPVAWNANTPGLILNKANAFRALMRVLKIICKAHQPTNQLLSKHDFETLLSKVTLRDEEFTLDNFKPGKSGENAIFARFISDMGLDSQKTLF